MGVHVFVCVCVSVCTCMCIQCHVCVCVCTMFMCVYLSNILLCLCTYFDIILCISITAIIISQNHENLFVEVIIVQEVKQLLMVCNLYVLYSAWNDC